MPSHPGRGRRASLAFRYRAAGAPWRRVAERGPSGTPGARVRRARREPAAAEGGVRRAGLRSAPTPDLGSGAPHSQPPRRGPVAAGEGGRQAARGGERELANTGAKAPPASPLGPAPHRRPARASHPALAAVVPARVGVGPVHGERRVAARHVGARTGNFPVSSGRRAASSRPCSGSLWEPRPRGRRGLLQLLPTPALLPCAAAAAVAGGGGGDRGGGGGAGTPESPPPSPLPASPCPPPRRGPRPCPRCNFSPSLPC